MYLFIAIILTAELIIAVTVVCLTVYADKKVAEFNKKVEEFKPRLQAEISAAKDAVAKFVSGVHKLCEFACRQREKYIISTIQNVLIYLLLIFLKGKSRKCVSALQLAFTLKDCWDKSCNSQKIMI